MPLPLTPMDFQKPEVVRLQQREWRVERIGWLAFGLLLVWGSLGGLGGGLLAGAAASAGPLRLDYERLVRHGVITDLRVSIGPEAIMDGRFSLRINQEFLRGVRLGNIRPTPTGMRSSGDQLLLDFAAPSNGGATVVVEIEPRNAGRRAGRIELGKTVLDFRQTVFP